MRKQQPKKCKSGNRSSNSSLEQYWDVILEKMVHSAPNRINEIIEMKSYPIRY